MAPFALGKKTMSSLAMPDEEEKESNDLSRIKTEKGLGLNFAGKSDLV